MAHPTLLRNVLLLILLITVFLATAQLDNDKNALLSFLEGIEKESQGALAWNTTANGSDFCSWIGVQCDSASRHVVSLSLPNYKLTGTISSSLGNLTQLSVLNLSGNNFWGEIPVTLGQCTSLASLQLGTNDLSGPIPRQLGQLPNLTFLELRVNSLTGTIPPELGNLTRLQRLDLSTNSLNGTIPEQLFACTSLNFFHLDMNHLTGSIPSSLGNLTLLQDFGIASNLITGVIPSSIGTCKNLQIIAAWRDSIGGEIPHEIGNLSNLNHFDLDINNLSGSLPIELGLLSQLTYLSMAHNKLSGSIPLQLANLTKLNWMNFRDNVLTGNFPGEGFWTSKPFLQTVRLDSNQLVGALDSSVSLATAMQVLWVHNNFLNGSIPDTLGSLVQLQDLDCSYNSLSGPIPETLGNLVQLTYMNCSNNSLTGPIPNLSNLRQLQTLYLQNNNLGGDIPAFLGTALPSLSQLHLDNNNLTGTVPQALASRQTLNFTARGNVYLVCNIAACGATSSSSVTPSLSSSHGSKIGPVVGGIVGGLAVLAILTAVLFALLTKGRRARSRIIKAIGLAENQARGEFPRIGQPLAGSLTLMTLQEISDATKKFTKKIGEGSFGPVYYGKLPNGQDVAVKVKSSESRQGLNEFLNEVELLSRIHHRNLVSLVGYCEEANQQILIYVYVSNGTLREHLYGDISRQPLDWKTRLDIALNSARGLEYLHTDCNPRIIHRDVKSSNILLDENLVAKVADFGISKQTPEGIFSGVDTVLKGTPGYFDPEYFTTQRLTQKSDVYSFGVVLLEIISGRHPLISEVPDGTNVTLIQWVQRAVRDGNPMDIVDPSLGGEFDEESVMKVLTLAVGCIDPSTENRPNMKQVVREITEAIEVELYSDKVTMKPDYCVGTTFSKGEDDGNDESQEVALVKENIPSTTLETVVEPIKLY